MMDITGSDGDGASSVAADSEAAADADRTVNRVKWLERKMEFMFDRIDKLQETVELDGGKQMVQLGLLRAEVHDCVIQVKGCKDQILSFKAQIRRVQQKIDSGEAAIGMLQQRVVLQERLSQQVSHHADQAALRRMQQQRSRFPPASSQGYQSMHQPRP